MRARSANHVPVGLGLGPVVSPVGDGFRYLDHYVYDALLEAIVHRRLAPGTRLVLDDLAEQLKVSRTPIRDALARLTSEGLVRRTEGLHADVLSEMDDLAEQGFCALRRGNHLAASLKDREFHRLLVSLGQNAKLTGLIEQLNIHIQTLRVTPGHETLKEQRKHYYQEHLEIVEALRVRDLAAAKAAIRHHIVDASLRAVAALESAAPAATPSE